MIISRMFKLSVSVIWCLIIIFSLGQTVSHAENKLILSINLINSRDYCEQYSDCVLTEQYSGCCTTACGVEAINIKTKNLEEETHEINRV